MNLLSIIIPTYNDPEIWPTVRSIIAGSGKISCEIIVIDDHSDVSLDIPNDLVDIEITIKLAVCELNLGPAKSRQLGANLAQGDWLMFCDSHMRFPLDWSEHVANTLSGSRHNDVHCSVYRSDVIFNSFWHDTHDIAGADFILWRHEVNQLDNTSYRFAFADLVPRRNDGRYEIPCVIGACYLVNTQWFKELGGYNHLIGYGCEEQMLSLGTWLMGGTVSVIPNLVVTHLYQGPGCKYKDGMVNSLIINRLKVLASVLTKEQYDNMSSLLPLGLAELMIAASITPAGWQRVRSYDEVAAMFGLQTYDEAMKLISDFHKTT